MFKFKVDIYAWIPQAEVDNPVYSVPGGVPIWGLGACGPYFGGDNFIVPPSRPSAWNATFRAMQTLSFEAASFGSQPSAVNKPAVVPGLTTILTAPRASGGAQCHAVTALVHTSTSRVDWNAAENWYEVSMLGEVEDPVPGNTGQRAGGAVGKSLGGPLGSKNQKKLEDFGKSAGKSIVSAATPSLEWKLDLKLHKSGPLPLTDMNQLTYMRNGINNYDVSGKSFGAPASTPGGGHLAHGRVYTRLFPSYVVYLTIDNGNGVSTCTPVYFSDASNRHLLTIGVGQYDPLRQVTF